ncbi:MAG: pyruvate, phosphate dikinase [Syntrophobacterales bacterium]|nr:MAG: pyruvate, phosphate dikinase [Syntrophobacterales bacterium]
MPTYVYFFGGGRADGNAQMKGLLGGKGANLAEMINLGIPVPPGFTISTKVCRYYYEHDETYPPELTREVEDALSNVEKIMETKFSDPENPLLVSVRSGAAISMPGMMDTILNLGLNDETVRGLAKRTEDERFVYDCYRRFVAMYGDVVLGLKPEDKDELDPFEVILDAKKEARGVSYDHELTVGDLRELVREFKGEIRRRRGVEFPEDPKEQLWGAIGAVISSWDNPRAIAYRELNAIPDDLGTAVNVQVMVFGNMGRTSGTGVAFSRDPATGENVFYGEYLLSAQGEDVVAGIRTPQPINRRQKGDKNIPSLEEEMPEVYGQLDEIREKLDRHYRDMQDIEFTIQQGKLWMLQTRVGKRTGLAALRMAVDMVHDGLITKEEALLRVEPDQLNQVLRPVFDSQEKKRAVGEGNLIAHGLNAGPGAATGKVVFSAPDAEEWASRGEEVLLVRIETSPEDIRGMNAAQGILTARGGMTSHAALVARQMGKVCVVGCGVLDINYKTQQMKVNGRIVKQGDYLSIDGTTGEVILGRVPTRPSEILQVLTEGSKQPEDSQIYRYYAELMSWADEARSLGVHTNADRPDQARIALAFGAEGIGLCRTEHMFFEGDRINAVREMILAEDSGGREAALAQLLPMQKEDFKGIFQEMGERPVTIRTLDPPLHEFLPNAPREIEELAKRMGVPENLLRSKIEALHENNPMLGHRGCRLGVVYPEITAMQARAIFEAACEVAKEGIAVHPEVMIPLVGDVRELANQRRVVETVAHEVFSQYGMQVEYKVGTMIEVPRGALTADQVAQEAEFFSFGTNDITQTTYGISRDDAGRFLHAYLDANIWDFDPFEKLDRNGVGQLMDIAVKKGRTTKSDLKIGICGEHGGEPSSVEFCHQIGLDYVSCSPFRVPIARLAAAHASLKEREGN